MRGHEALLAMRRKGYSPQWVFIDTWADPLGFWGCWPVETPHRASVEVHDADMLSGLDFRFVVGLQVLVMGEKLARLQAIAEACKEAGAKRVVIGHEEHVEDWRAEDVPA